MTLIACISKRNYIKSKGKEKTFKIVKNAFVCVCTIRARVCTNVVETSVNRGKEHVPAGTSSPTMCYILEQDEERGKGRKCLSFQRFNSAT